MNKIKNEYDVVLLELCHISNQIETKKKCIDSTYLFNTFSIFRNYQEGEKLNYPFRKYFNLIEENVYYHQANQTLLFDKFQGSYKRNLLDNDGNPDKFDSHIKMYEWQKYTDDYKNRTIIVFSSNKPIDYQLTADDLIVISSMVSHILNKYTTYNKTDLIITGSGIGGLLAQVFYMIMRSNVEAYHCFYDIHCKTYNTPNIKPFIDKINDKSIITSYLSSNTPVMNHVFFNAISTNKIADAWMRTKEIDEYLVNEIYEQYIANNVRLITPESSMYSVLEQKFYNQYKEFLKIWLNTGIINKVKSFLFANKSSHYIHESEQKLLDIGIAMFTHFINGVSGIRNYQITFLDTIKDNNITSINTFINYPNNQVPFKPFSNNIDISGINKDSSLYYDISDKLIDYKVENFIKYLDNDGYLYPGKIRFTLLTNMFANYLHSKNYDVTLSTLDTAVEMYRNDETWWLKYPIHSAYVYKKAFSKVKPYLLIKRANNRVKAIIGINVKSNIIKEVKDLASCSTKSKIIL